MTLIGQRAMFRPRHSVHLMGADIAGLTDVLPKALLITGTDTDVGKTVFAEMLLRKLVTAGLCAQGMKPISSGATVVDGQLRNTDALSLQNASFKLLPYEWVNPYCFAPAIAPHLAAKFAGTRIDPAHVDACFQKICASAQILVVEGAGGWLSPLSDQWDHQHLALQCQQRVALDVVLIVSMRLGCIHQARATLRAILADGVPCVGWVANSWQRDGQTMPCLRENIDSLRQYLSVPCIGESLAEAADHLVQTLAHSQCYRAHHAL